MDGASVQLLGEQLPHHGKSVPELAEVSLRLRIHV